MCNFLFYALLTSGCILSLGHAKGLGNQNSTTNLKTGLRDTVQINNETFYFGRYDHSTWYDAEDKCILLGMQLVTLDTAERWTMISDWITAHPDYDFYCWAAGRKATNEANFRWVTTGEMFDFTAWLSGEPNRGATLESCINFFPRQGGWSDEDCMGFKYMYMCETKPQ